MIDYDDVDLFLLLSPTNLISLILLVVLLFFAFENESDCSKKACSETMSPKIIKGECMCIVRAK